MEKKYEMVKDDVNIDVRGKRLYRIRALKDFGNVKKGDIGGYIEKEENLSHEGNCWVYDDAVLFGDTEVSGNAKIYDNARINGNSKVYGNVNVHDYTVITDNAEVTGNVRIYDNAILRGNVVVYGDVWIRENATLYGNARVHGNAMIARDAVITGDVNVSGNAKILENAYLTSSFDYITIGPIETGNDNITFYLDKNRNICVKQKCFNGSINEFEYKLNALYGYNEIYKNQYLNAITFAKNHFHKNPNDSKNDDIMQVKQVKTYDIEHDRICSGLLLQDGSVICGCCGGVVPKNQIDSSENCTHKILKVYETWVDLDDEILD